MNTENIKVPEDLMKNVENKLRNHVKNKKKRFRIYASAAILTVAIMVPVSVFAYNKYIDDIPFKQEINLARKNNNITKLNRTFKYKNVEFNVKNVLADETGIEVIYEASDPNYSISGFSLKDKSGKNFESYGYCFPTLVSKEKEKAFYITMDEDVVEYMKNNALNININKVSYRNDKNKLLSRKNKDIKVDWNLKSQLKMQNIKKIPVNKEYELDIGKIEIKSLNMGVLKTVLEYDFKPKDKNIRNIQPMFSLRIDDKYINNTEFNEPLSYTKCASEFKSIYYKKPKEIGIKLIGLEADYIISDKNSKKYEVIKEKLPMEFNYEGDKFKIISMEEKNNSIEYKVEFSKDNRTYKHIDIAFGDSSTSNFDYGEVNYKNKAQRQKVYDILLRKTPNLNHIYDNGKNLKVGTLTSKVKNSNKSDNVFRIYGAQRDFIYDLNEIVINNFKNK